ncbi:unnamed protein product [Paramecium octaurelia]|uniref:Uncharacterized protein n=1 Tax=Paramecium octaurelia TaxID=43137 RepID=A0A8S1XJ52_PAROT|nr:unnamed protein product [Paramecium octaurelia]
MYIKYDQSSNYTRASNELLQRVNCIITQGQPDHLGLLNSL